MNIFEIIFLAFALGVDCFTLSFSQGLIYKSNKIKNALLLGVTMGFFQFFMPYIGYFGTNTIISYVKPFAKLIAFLIFFILGIKFILESFDKKEEIKIIINFKNLIMFGIATSIDALFSGINLKLSNTNILYSSVVIGLASFLLSLLGFLIANIFKKMPNSKCFEILGGIILIMLAIKAIL